ncbi:MAG: S-layer homology domain-containing protein, partial [Clostridiales Family XIII bacterium]|nr:S-layer homology domain-containing protein [Clostridiales Family XIII bacterium]
RQGAFADEAEIGAWATDAVNAMYAAGILSGKPGELFDPKGDATRAEVAATLHRFIVAAGEGAVSPGPA